VFAYPNGNYGGGMAETPPDQIDRRKGMNREKILDAAAERLAEHGYGATSLSDIAMLTGVDPAMVSFHFPTVEDLVDAVLRAGIDFAKREIDAALAPLGSTASGADRLAKAMGAYLHAIRSHQHVTRANIRCYRSVPPVVRRGLAVHMREFVEIWSELLEAGSADGSLRADIDPDLNARVMIAALNSTVTQSTAADLAHVTTQLTSTLLEGLQAA
jgi:AcrR family transcriptional regulator